MTSEATLNSVNIYANKYLNNAPPFQKKGKTPKPIPFPPLLIFGIERAFIQQDLGMYLSYHPSDFLHIIFNVEP